MAETIDAGTPTAEQADTIYLSLELSQQSWLAVLCVGLAGKLSRHKLAAGDVAGLLQLIARAGRGRRRVLSCYEAGADGFWLHRRLVAAGIANVVIDPSSLRVDRRARRRKTDRLDGEAMLRALLAWLRGDRQALRVVRVPSAELEDARRAERERERLVKERTAQVARMRSLLVGVGIGLDGEGRAFSAPGWPGWLGRQRQWDGRPVPAQLGVELLRQHDRLRLLERQLAALAAAAPALPAEQSRQVATLMRLKGVGPAISRGLAGEVLWHGFANRRQVAAYIGLDPSPWRSGKLSHEQGIGRAGNRRARRLMIEASWLWLRHQPQHALSRWYRDRVGQARGRVRRIAIIAVARKLSILLWRLASTGEQPENVVLKPPPRPPARRAA
jgi:transposase